MTENSPPAASLTPAATVAIVGGGMVGLSLALLLAKALPEAKITLLEALPIQSQESESPELYQPSFDARTSALAYGSRDLLQAMGVWSELSQHLTQVDRVHVSDRGHIGGCRMTAAEYQVPALGYVVDNRWLGACLLRTAQQQPNIELIASSEVTRLQPVRQGYRVHYRVDGAEQERRVQLAVIADGASSKMRAALGIDIEHKHYEQTAIIANVAFSQPHEGTAFERFTADGPVAILPRGESSEAGVGGLIWTQPHARAQALAQASTEEFLSQLQLAFGQRLGRFIRVGERHNYPLSLTKAREQIRPHLVVMGNAAHALHPVAGQGFNLSLRDSARLAEQLAKPSAQPFANLSQLQAYQREQQYDQWLTVHFSDLLPQLFSSSRPVQAAGRGLGLWSLELLPAAKAQLARQSMGQRGRAFANFTRQSFSAG